MNDDDDERQTKIVTNKVTNIMTNTDYQQQHFAVCCEVITIGLNTVLCSSCSSIFNVVTLLVTMFVRILLVERVHS